MRAIATLAVLAATAGAISVIPAAYEVEATFQIPYFNHVEKSYIWADTRNGGVARMSYYSGANVYIIDNRTSDALSYSIVPALDQLTCTSSSFGGFKSAFPDLSLFTPLLSNGRQRTAVVNGILCGVWHYTYSDPETNPVGGTFNPPTDAGYVGQYYWFQNLVTAAPVRFLITGHNVVFGGSHVDEYIVDYGQIIPAPMAGWPEEFFQPPQNMPCVNGDSPFGPTHQKTLNQDPTVAREMLKNHGRTTVPHLATIHPDAHGAEARRQLADTHAHAYRHVLGGNRHTGEASGRVQTAARFVSARNRELAAKRATYTVGLNHFAHMARDEFQHLTGYKAKAHKNVKANDDGSWPLGPGLPNDSCEVHVPTGLPIPDSVDLLPRNLVNPPMDQGTCGSCWSFGAIGAIEGALAKAAGDGRLPTRLSEQQMMDCTWEYGNNGCNGGTDFNAYSWIIQKNGGLVATDESYGGYLNHDGFCHYDISKNWTSTATSTPKPGVRVVKCVHINNQFNFSTSADPSPAVTETIRDVLANVGVPVSVAIDATLPDFYYYTGGLYQDSGCMSGTEDLDHQVLAVGYKTVDGIPYTHIKNSWSDNWGEGGFVWISQAENDCGVATSGTYIVAETV